MGRLPILLGQRTRVGTVDLGSCLAHCIRFVGGVWCQASNVCSETGFGDSDPPDNSNRFPKRLRREPRILALTLVITFISGANFFSILMFWPTQAFNVYGHDPVGVGVRGKSMLHPTKH
jgi:hypothetical protein